MKKRLSPFYDFRIKWFSQCAPNQGFQTCSVEMIDCGDLWVGYANWGYLWELGCNFDPKRFKYRWHTVGFCCSYFKKSK